MSLRRPRFDEEEPAQAINISPLIDVIFILLIFFIVTMEFADGVNLRIDVPGTAQKTPPKDSHIIVAISSDGRILFEGEDMSLEQLTAELKSRISARRAAVLLRADSSVPVSRLVQVMDSAKAAGADEIYVAAKTK